MLTKPLHHFYIIEGETDLITDLLSHLEIDHEIESTGNPDFHQATFEEIFGVEESRSLKDFFTTRAFGGNKKVAVVALSRITTEAQNALLKLAEEPAEGQHLMLIVPSATILLDTLVSRAHIIVRSVPREIESNDFLCLSIPERLKKVQKIITKKDRQAAAFFIDGIISSLKDTPTDGARGKQKYDALIEAYECRSFITDQSASIKLILEHLSLILPL